MIDIKADDIAVCIEIDDETRDDLARLSSRRALELDIKAVCLWVIMQFHSSLMFCVQLSQSRFRPREAIPKCAITNAGGALD